MQNTKEKTSSDKPKLRIIPLGGLEEVGRNMMVLSYQNPKDPSDEDIIIIDIGLQFPEENMPGIDYIIPNTACLKNKQDKIRGVIITHGHYDHIGGIPHSMGRLGNPTIYTAALTKGMIIKRQSDFPRSPKLHIEEIDEKSKINLGHFKIEFFRVNHNIPDSMGVIIHTPVGIIVHTGDFKFDREPLNEAKVDIPRLRRLGKKGVLFLMSDSTDSQVPGKSLTETEIHKNLEKTFRTIKGRIIIATFASLLTRVQSIIWLAEKFGRKVVIDGYSMKTNVAVARELGYLKIDKDTVISPRDAEKLPDDKVLILCTGAQGERNAVLMRLATGEHRTMDMKKGDTVFFSSSVVPGNERTVQSVRDALCRKGAKVLHYEMMDIHAGGHAYADDLQKMIEIIQPKFFMPIEGNYFMLVLHAEIAQKAGIKQENIMMASNGDIILLDRDSIKLSSKKVPASYVMVDGLGVGDVGQVVLRDRQAMAEDGMFVIISVVDSKTGKVKGEPDIISRGFVYLRESQDLLKATRERAKDIIHKSASPEHTTNWNYVKGNLRDDIGELLYKKTKRRPMVLPVIIEV